jgi:hypothetical protein
MYQFVPFSLSLVLGEEAFLFSAARFNFLRDQQNLRSRGSISPRSIGSLVLDHREDQLLVSSDRFHA